MGKLPSRFIDNFEQQLYDFRLRTDLINTPQHPNIDERIVILDIDEKSISELGHWPWSRTVISQLMERLFNDYEIKVIGFDIVFPEQELSAADELVSELKRLPEFSSPEITGLLEQTSTLVDGDNRLAESIAARNVVVGYTFEQFAGDEFTYQQKGVLSEPVIYQEQLSETNLQLAFYNAGGFVANYEYLTYATLYGGFFNYPRESSTLRKVPLLYNYDGSFYPSLALQTALVALEEEQVEFLFDPNSTEQSSLTLEYLKVGERRIPVDGQAAVYVPYRGGSYSFPYVSSVDVLNGSIDKADLQDKILLFGTTATGLVDLRATPVNDSFPGVEVHANIIAGILDERFKLKPSYTIAIEVIMLLVLTGMLHYVLPRFGALGTFIISPLAFVLVFSSGYFTWHNLNLVIPMASSILLVATLIFLHVLYDFFVESRQKRRMNAFFEQYIPAELVKELDQEERELSLSGDSREMTVLFSDVRNFTTLSESMEPGELTQLMNEFLTPITRVIHETKGTIDKYMGDAVMAFWGAPLSDPEHARHGVKAALKIQEEMSALKDVFQAKGWPEIQVGVGISSGTMQVGNMGSQFRMAYTVMGNTVNIGSRLEGLTKHYGVDILVSEQTKEMVPEVRFKEIDTVRVKGKNKPVTIFQPVSETENLESHNQALTAYKNMDWDVAEKQFSALYEQEALTLYSIYLERIREYKQTPPPEDWDRVFTHRTK